MAKCESLNTLTPCAQGPEKCSCLADAARPGDDGGAPLSGIVRACWRNRRSLHLRGRFQHPCVTFVDNTGEQRSATDRSHHCEFFNDQVTRHVLWDPHSHESCIAELITGKPEIANGAWQPVSHARVVICFALPVITVAMIYAANHITL